MSVTGRHSCTKFTTDLASINLQRFVKDPRLCPRDAPLIQCTATLPFFFTRDLDCTRSVQEVGVKNVNEMIRTEEELIIDTDA